VWQVAERYVMTRDIRLHNAIAFYTPGVIMMSVCRLFAQAYTAAFVMSRRTCHVLHHEQPSRH